MIQSNRSLQRLILVLALSFSFLIAALAPTGYFLISQQSLRNTLEYQSELTNDDVKSIVQSNPHMWRYEELRLSELLNRRANDEVPQLWSISDSAGEVIAKSNETLPSPIASYSRNMYDAGTVIGHIKVSRSLRPLLFKTMQIAVFSILLATGLFFVFRALPMRVIKKAFQKLEESEKKYRSLYETMKEGMALHHVEVDINGAISSLTVIDANPSCLAMFNNNLTKVIGCNSLALFGNTFQEFLSDQMKLIETGNSIFFELLLPGTDSYYKVQAFSPNQGLIATLFEDITERRKSEQKIQKMAYLDTLTGLPNRTLFFDRLNQGLALADRNNSSLAVLFLDLDRFKNINDTLGHTSGDQLLIQVTERFHRNIRSYDTLARMGGDEFVVVITSLDNQLNASIVAQNLLNSIQPPFLINGNKLHITASIGIALYPEDGDNSETLVKHADMAMYSAKESGRNTFNFFSFKMNEKAIKRMEIESGLRSALDQKEFFIEFQPILCASTQTIVAAEALVRWNHPTRGRIPPNDFINLAEESDIILQLGEWVLRTVCSHMKSWNDAGLPQIRYSVNVLNP